MCEESEVKECLWLPPATFLQMVREAKLLFLPPQVYELSRLVAHKSFDYLKQFSWNRRKKGLTMYRPIGHVCTDGVVFVFPGDDFYTGAPYQATVSRNMKCTTAEFRARAKRINRIENPDAPNAALYFNNH